MPEAVGPNLPSTADKLDFLGRSIAYPDQDTAVDTIETHMSWIFLSRENAWKLKKPVRHDFLDFRSVSARREYCEEEVRLNRRLALDVYLEAVPLAVDTQGILHVGGPGRPVDWLVKMRRLPADEMLDRAIRAGTVDTKHLQAVARMLADFFADAVPVVMPPSEYRRRFADAVTLYRRCLTRPEYELPRRIVETVAAALRKMLMGHASLFDNRVRRGGIREGHGDLRAEHVLLGPKPAVIDCIEFNREFRLQDRLDELSFLALECEFHGSPGAGKVILEECCSRLGDDPAPELIAFYKTFRAMMRAHLSIQHLEDEVPDEPEHWRERALSYLTLARRHAGAIG